MIGSQERAMTEKPLEAGSGLGTASQAFAQAADCERLAMLTPDGERRQILRTLKCAWIQLGGEMRTSEILLRARGMRRGRPARNELTPPR
jgi:hypothetical protein